MESFIGDAINATFIFMRAGVWPAQYSFVRVSVFVATDEYGRGWGGKRISLRHAGDAAADINLRRRILPMNPTDRYWCAEEVHVMRAGKKTTLLLECAHLDPHL